MEPLLNQGAHGLYRYVSPCYKDVIRLIVAKNLSQTALAVLFRGSLTL